MSRFALFVSTLTRSGGVVAAAAVVGARGGLLHSPSPVSGTRSRSPLDAPTTASQLNRWLLPRNYTPCAVFLPLKTTEFRQRRRFLDEEGCRSASMANWISCHTQPRCRVLAVSSASVRRTAPTSSALKWRCCHPVRHPGAALQQRRFRVRGSRRPPPQCDRRRRVHWWLPKVYSAIAESSARGGAS
jgi:hypothetical protein